MEEFEKLNEERLAAFSELVEQGNLSKKLWDEYFAGNHTGELAGRIQAQNQHVKNASERQERAREAMFKAGYLTDL